jgi:tetratricopeptide (TPR) repeat protein
MRRRSWTEARQGRHAFRPGNTVTPLVSNVTGAYSVETSRFPCTEGVLSSVRLLTERVKRPSCCYATEPFRVHGIASTLELMPASDETEVAVLTGGHETARAELLHEPFFRALAALEGQEGGSEWRALIAGLVTLRLADRRIASAEYGIRQRLQLVPESGFTADVPAEVIEAAHAATGAVDNQDSVAEPLRELVQSASAVIASDLPERLLAYAHALHADSRWPLAADVYRTVLRFAAAPHADNAPAVRALVPHVYDRLGRSLRMTGDIDGAKAAYQAGRKVAWEIGDLIAEPLIRISEANVLMHVGNLPAAAATLDQIIEDATAAKSPPHGLPSRAADRQARSAFHDSSDQLNVLALAHHDRAVVASRQGDFNVAAEHYYAAWRGYRDPVWRERACADFAQSLAEMGLYDAARDPLLLLYTRAHRREIRLIAATNLLELAVLERREDLFETYRCSLHEAARAGVLPAEVAAKFALYEGRGEVRFGRPDAAAAAFYRALELAALHQVHEVTIRADEAIAALKSERSARDWFPPITPVTMSRSVERITRTVRRIRRRAGAPRHS